jgi:hypothetical protein
VEVRSEKETLTERERDREEGREGGREEEGKRVGAHAFSGSEIASLI